MREKDVSNTPAFWLPQGNQCSLVLEQNLCLQPYPLELETPASSGIVQKTTWAGLSGRTRSKEIGRKREKPGNKGWAGDSYGGWGGEQVQRRPPQARLWPEGPARGQTYLDANWVSGSKVE